VTACLRAGSVPGPTQRRRRDSRRWRTRKRSRSLVTSTRTCSRGPSSDTGRPNGHSPFRRTCGRGPCGRCARRTAPALERRRASPRQLETAGWIRMDAKIGERITITGRPRRDGKPDLLLTSLVTADGPSASGRRTAVEDRRALAVPEPPARCEQALLDRENRCGFRGRDLGIGICQIVSWTSRLQAHERSGG